MRTCMERIGSDWCGETTFERDVDGRWKCPGHLRDAQAKREQFPVVAECVACGGVVLRRPDLVDVCAKCSAQFWNGESK